MDAAEVSELNDDELIALIESLDAHGDDRGRLSAALDELFRRIRAEAARGERSSVEAAIARLTWIFSHGDDDDGPDVGGVREPRRPPPRFDAMSAACRCSSSGDMTPHAWSAWASSRVRW